jgi:steroid 5-alpha reductase family enzyme
VADSFLQVCSHFKLLSFASAHFSLQAKGLCFSVNFPDGWQYHPQFVIGLVVFFCGFTVNVHCDAILRRMRSESKEYRIPNGSVFRFVSTPHYFGEIVEWSGFVLANRFSLASTAFLVYTMANLIPRGIEHHAWYQEVFGDKYPKNRKAVIPFIL